MRTESTTSILFSCNVAFHFSVFGNLKETVAAGVFTNLIIFLNLCIGIHIYECASFYLSTCIYLSIPQSIYLSFCSPSEPSIWLFVYLSVCVSVCLSICLFNHVFIFIFVLLVSKKTHEKSHIIRPTVKIFLQFTPGCVRKIVYVCIPVHSYI